MSSTPRVAAAALVRASASAIVPRVVAEATAGDRKTSDTMELERRLTAYLERRIPLCVQALEADDRERGTAIRRLLRTDADAGQQIPPVVLLGTVAIGYRLIESEIRARAPEYGFSHEALWAEMDLLRRTVGEMRRRFADDEGAA
ncbi:MAG: hypothetical protein E6J15_14265 [Chloroflexi bacterium]|nr:MAG: hypothetical protein E6J15_14265 [Chloroflexota bacterium]